MNTPGMTGSLMFFTLGAVALLAIVALLWFLRKPKNRHPLPDEHPIGTPASGSEPHDEARAPDQ